MFSDFRNILARYGGKCKKKVVCIEKRATVTVKEKGSSGTEVDELNMNISGAGKETSLTDAVKRTRITENNHFSGRYYYG